MQATERLLAIEQFKTDVIARIAPIELDGQTLRLVLFLSDGSNLRVIEQWQGNHLLRYSYYWLTEQNHLIIGWDNSLHHSHVTTHPHHKHVGQQTNIQSSAETNLEDVLMLIRSQLS